MHICFVTQEYPPETNWGGIATYTRDMAKALVSQGHQVSVIALSMNQKAYQVQQEDIRVHRIVPAGARYYSLPGFRHLYRLYNGYSWEVYKQLKKIHKEHPIDLIETPNLHGEALFWQLWGPKKPVVIRLHSSSRHNRMYNQRIYDWKAKLDFLQERWALKKAHAVSAVSKCIITYNRDLLPAHVPLRVIGNPLYLEKEKPMFTQKQSPPIVLYAGRLSQRKGFPTLVRAIPQIVNNHKKVRIAIAGSDGRSPEGGSMKEWAIRQLGMYANQVTFLGVLDRKEMVDYYKKARIVVFPTLFEPFGYISLEAMAYGAVLVASNLDGPAEVVEHGRTGLLFEPENAEDLAQNVNRALSDDFPYCEMQEAAWNHVNTWYNESEIAKQTEVFYQEILQQ